MIWKVKMEVWQKCPGLEGTMRRDSRLRLQPVQLNRHPRSKQADVTTEASEYADILNAMIAGVRTVDTRFSQSRLISSTQIPLPLA